jgi:hypothetical protein
MSTLRFQNVRNVPIFAALSFCVALSGCGSDPTGGSRNETLYPVKGQVILPNGKPLTGGTVVFKPQSGQDAAPRGAVDSNGNFTLKWKDGEGAPAGDYKVYIEPDASIMKLKKGKPDPSALPFPAKYADTDGDTGLTATVKAEPNTLAAFKLTVDKDGGRKAARD